MNGAVEKLVALVRNPPEKKAHVVEALGELRKLLEAQGERQRLGTLNFFCDWVAAGTLDPEPAREFLWRLDERLGQCAPDDPDYLTRVDDALDPISLSLLRDEFEELCERAGVPLTWTYDDEVWDKVVALLAEALRKSPLKLNRKNCGFTRLREAVVSIYEPDESITGPQPGPVFGFKWKWTLEDGSTYNLSRHELLTDAPEDEPDDTA